MPGANYFLTPPVPSVQRSLTSSATPWRNVISARPTIDSLVNADVEALAKRVLTLPLPPFNAGQAGKFLPLRLPNAIARDGCRQMWNDKSDIRGFSSLGDSVSQIAPQLLTTSATHHSIPVNPIVQHGCNTT